STTTACEPNRNGDERGHCAAGATSRRNTNMKKLILLGGMLAGFIAFPILTSLLAHAAVTGAGSPPTGAVTSVDLSKFDCRTLLPMEGADRDRAMVFLHGYVSAQKRQTVIELGPLAEASEKIVDFCIDHPTSIALTVFTSNR